LLLKKCGIARPDPLLSYEIIFKEKRFFSKIKAIPLLPYL